MNKILVIDIETSGFLNQGGKIVEAGIVELDLDSGIKKILFNKIINPGLADNVIQNSWIVKNKYMNLIEIKNADNFCKYKEEIQSIIDKYDNGVTAFNRSFDIDFLKSEGIEFKKLLPCPMQLSVNVLKIPPTERMKMYGYGHKFKTPNAQESYNYFYPESGYIELHRGADDAMHEADIVKKLYDLEIFKIN